MSGAYRETNASEYLGEDEIVFRETTDRSLRCLECQPPVAETLRGADHENTAAAPSVLRCYISPIQDLASLYLGKSGSLDMNIVGPCVVD